MNRKTLAAFLCGAASLATHAVYISSDGTGQALIYPYFTAQTVAGSAMNTYVSILNQRGAPKALRVRVREGRNGRELASINVMLPQSDMWTFAVVPTAAGARLVTRDKSCTEPALTAGETGESYLDLSNRAYVGGSADGLGDDSERLREGYIEVIEMATIETFGPLECASFRAGQMAFAGADNGISGTLTLINVASGMEFSTNPVALAELLRGSIFRPAADPYPDFDASEIDPVATFVIEGKSYRSTMASGLAAVEAVLTKQTIANEIVLDSATSSGTDWVFTMPTRRFHASAAAGDPFFTAFVPGTRDIEASLTATSREGPPYIGIQNGCDPTCSPSHNSADLRMPWTSTVWSFGLGTAASASGGPSEVLGSRNGWRITLPTTAENGSGDVIFGHPGLRVPLTNFNATSVNLRDGSSETRSFRLIGLPAVGFMARTFHNGFLSCGSALCQGNYGGLFEHKWQALISPNTL